MDPILRYLYIGFALTTAMIAAVVVAVASPQLRIAAAVAFLALVVARLVVGALRSRVLRRRIVVLKADNGGALPIPNPVRVRRTLTALVAVLGVFGVVALALGAITDDTVRLILTVLGASFLVVAAIIAVQGWRLFRQRAAADSANEL